MTADATRGQESPAPSMNRAPAHPAYTLFPYLLMGLCAAYYLVFFLLSAAAQHDSLWPAAAPHQTSGYVQSPIALGALGMAIGGLTALVIGQLAGIYAARGIGKPILSIRATHAEFFLFQDAAGAQTRYTICLFGVIAVALLNLLQLRFPVLYQILSGAVFFCVAVLRHDQIGGAPRRAARIAGYLALALLLLSYASMQQWTGLFLILLFLALIDLLYRRHQWIIWGAVLLVALPIYPMKRTILPAKIASICIPAGEPVMGRYLIEIVAKCQSRENLEALSAAVLPWARDQVLRRISTIRLLDRAWHETPERIPYYRGETLRPLLYVVVPRFLWPNKPREDIGNRIGHTYRVLSPADHVTSINLPWIVEFYINFGIPGVLGGLALTGFLMGGIAWLGVAASRSEVIALLTISVLFPLTYQESNLSLMLGNTLHGLVGILGLLALVYAAERFGRRVRPTRLVP